MRPSARQFGIIFVCMLVLCLIFLAVLFSYMDIEKRLNEEMIHPASSVSFESTRPVA